MCLGITAWNALTGKEKLNPSSDQEPGQTFVYDVGSWLRKKGLFLNSNHTHFLLVDDKGETNAAQVKFRTDFENYMVDKFKGNLRLL